MTSRRSCGLGPCRPRWMLRFATIGWFTFFAALFGFTFGLFPLYTVSQITTIERHYDLSSQKSGMIVSSSEIGFVLAAIVVGYFLNYAHRPRILGYCTLAIMAATQIAVIPLYLDLISGRKVTPSHLLSTTNDTCSADVQATCDVANHVEESSVSNAFWIFLTAMIFFGAGSCGMWTIGISYIDDNADKKKSYLYISLVICIRLLSPVGGMMLGAAVVPVPVHLVDYGGSPTDSDWVGAWWIGYYVIFVLVSISSVPIWFYPRILQHAGLDKRTPTVFTIDNPYTEFSQYTDSNQNLQISVPDVRPSVPTNLQPETRPTLTSQHSKAELKAELIIPKLDSTHSISVIQPENPCSITSSELVNGSNPSNERQDSVLSAVNGAIRENKLTIGNHQLHEMNLDRQISRQLSSTETATILLKGFPQAIWRLLTNPVFMLVSVGTSIDYSISVGFATFVPKFLEMYFQTTVSVANAITGGSLALSAAVGTGLGGFMMARVRMRFNRMFLIAILVNMSFCLLVVPMVLLTCPGVNMLGLAAGTGNFSSACNAECNCRQTMYNPVCYQKTAYYSPCHAGCTSKLSNTTYGQCACADSTVVMKTGLCNEPCNVALGIYAALLTVLVLALGAASIPPFMLTIRCIEEVDKSLALAVTNVFTCIFAFPLPILYGTLIDGVCLVLRRAACSEGAACIIYDNENFKHRMHFLTLGLKAIPTSLFLLAWYLSRHALFPGDEKLAPTLSSSVSSASTTAIDSPGGAHDNPGLEIHDEQATRAMSLSRTARQSIPPQALMMATSV